MFQLPSLLSPYLFLGYSISHLTHHVHPASTLKSIRIAWILIIFTYYRYHSFKVKMVDCSLKHLCNYWNLQRFHKMLMLLFHIYSKEEMSIDMNVIEWAWWEEVKNIKIKYLWKVWKHEKNSLFLEKTHF